MFGLFELDFDSGETDTLGNNAEEVDLDGDGVADGFGTDENGDGVIDTVWMDTDGDGMPDAAYVDTNGDGIYDSLTEYHDYNQDGIFDSTTTYSDTDQDGNIDQVMKAYDSDGDGQIDTFKTHYDTDGDGRADKVIEEQFLDRDGDGTIDTYIYGEDEGADGSFEIAEAYDFDITSGELQPLDLGETGRNGTYYDELEQFDPDSVDPANVSGNPGQSMEEWEFQGNTNRCALYSQKFVIEELTGRDVDIEEIADLAEENGWFSEESGTSLLDMNKVLDYYGVENTMSFHNDIDDIRECLDSGGKVIVSLDADEIWHGESDDLFSPTASSDHAVEVIGIDYSNPDEPMVILNDSGSPNGCGEMVPLDTFMDAWEDGDCQMVTCG